MTNLIGQSLGRYHILEQLGEGGMATVYKAYDTRLESEVAVKVIRTENLPQSGVERSLKRFEREAKSLAKLTHANIVKVLDYGEYEGKPYLVMPFLQGGTLKQLLHGKPMPYQEAARLLIPVARALAYAHELGVIHRDVKPANILITASGDPMLTDFGIAKIIDEESTMDLTGTSAAVGTPEYMAPEQVTSKHVDRRADIYALGIVFYEMVTGRKPFQADTPMAVLFKHASEPLPRPRQFAPKIPDEVEQVLLKALAKQPVHRFQHMMDFTAALEHLVGTTGEGQKPSRIAIGKDDRYSKSKPKLISPSRSRSILLGAGIFALIVAIGISGRLISSDQLPPFLTWLRIESYNPSPVLVTPKEKNEIATLTYGQDLMTGDDGAMLVYVPAGEFEMGNDDGRDDERPMHVVYLDAYWIDIAEITNSMYDRCVKAGGCKKLFNEANISDTAYADHPVVYVSWDDASEYCSWVNRRLPTEAEWEKAASWNESTKRKSTFPWGETITDWSGCGFANYRPRDEFCVGGTAPVAAYPAGVSAYGIYDMAGNVWEWVGDWYGMDYYQNSPSTNPTGPYAGDSRVLRGGAWNSYEDLMGSTYRRKSFHGTAAHDIGFRCAASASEMTGFQPANAADFSSTLVVDTPVSQTIYLSVDIPTNCRSGPGTDFNVVGLIEPGEIAQLVGKNADGMWGQIMKPDVPGEKCWVASAVTVSSGSWNYVPMVPVP